MESSSNQFAPIVWVDLEMTGLDLNKEQIIEIAVIVTDSQLNITAQMDDSIVIHCSDDLLNNMNEWCVQHHGESGLTQRARDSKITLRDAEKMVLQFLKQNGVECNTRDMNKKPILAGNSVYVDRQFIAKQMPELNGVFHYRIIDVSGVKELCRRWYPQQFSEQPPKKTTHRALDDIIESIQELQYYRQSIFK